MAQMSLMNGIECEVQASGLVTVGIGPGGPRHTVFKRKTESVRGRFYSLVQKSPRGYQLTKAPRLFLVNTMIRYPNIIFAGGSVGKAPRESRSGVHVLEDDMHNLINGSG